MFKSSVKKCWHAPYDRPRMLQTLLIVHFLSLWMTLCTFKFWKIVLKVKTKQCKLSLPWGLPFKCVDSVSWKLNSPVLNFIKIIPTILQLLHLERWTDIRQGKVFYPKDEGDKQVLECCYLLTSYTPLHIKRPRLDSFVTLRNFISFETNHIFILFQA